MFNDYGKDDCFDYVLNYNYISYAEINLEIMYNLVPKSFVLWVEVALDGNWSYFLRDCVKPCDERLYATLRSMASLISEGQRQALLNTQECD
jgi:hypothetical protein